MIHDWIFDRGPKLGEDILAWAREEIDSALAWVVEEGMLIVATTDENSKPIEEPVIRLVLPESSADDVFLEKPLAVALWNEINGDLENDGSFDERSRERMTRLRDVLRQHADLIDKHLAVAPEPKREPKWRKLPLASSLLREPNFGRKALHELAYHVTLLELLTGDVEELAGRVEKLPYYGPRLRGLLLYSIPPWREDLEAAGEYEAALKEAQAQG